MPKRKDDRELGSLLARELSPEGELWSGVSRRIAGASSNTTADDTDPVVRLAQELHREVAPERDLWFGIRNRIRDGAGAPTTSGWAAFGFIRSPGQGWARAAALATVVIATTLALQNQASPPAGRPTQGSVDGRLAAIDGEPFSPGTLGPAGIHPVASQSRPELLRALAEDPSVSPETLAIIKRNLRTIDQALAEIRTALESDPSNAGLYRMLGATYRQEAALLTQIRRGGHSL